MTNRPIWEQENLELHLEVERLRKRIEELEAECDETTRQIDYLASNERVITHDQIDAAWIYVEGCENPGERDWMLLAFDKLGIERCGKCDGEGSAFCSTEEFYAGGEETKTCPDCDGRGWVWKRVE
jgi:hypothetical protein